MANALLLAALAAAAAAPGVLATKLKYNTKAAPAGIVPGAINVHLVPHTHDDVGWLKTVDQYTYGGNNSIQHAMVQYILDTSTGALTENPDRRFIYVEQAFFQRWWAEQSDTKQASVRQLVADGQLEFINGGWCMHDEAAPSYVDMIDQTTLGHRFIKQEFGVAPRVAWQIDPFGHSGTHASLFGSPLSGAEALMFWRIDYQDRAQRSNTSNLEFIWRPSVNQGSNQQTLTGIMPSYGPPSSQLCFDTVACGDTAPVQDDTNLEDYNVQYYVNLTVSTAVGFAGPYKASPDGTVHIMWPMGSDFQHENSYAWFKSLDKLIHYVNVNTSYHRVNLMYSTPSLYMDAKRSQGLTFSLKTDDFFPYADGPHAMWSGYFTSRPALKGYIREASSWHQASRQMQFFSGGAADLSPSNSLYLLERALGVNQHHDAVSGTSKQHVAYDYALRIARGRTAADAGNNAALQTLAGDKTLTFATCDLANATICPALASPTAGQAVALVAWNHQAQAKTSFPVRVPVALPTGVASWSVVGPDGKTSVQAQLVPASPSDVALRTAYYNASVPAGTSFSWLVFLADLPAAGYATFFLTPAGSAGEAASTHASKVVRLRTSAAKLMGRVRDSTLTNGIVTLTISAATGAVSGYSNTANGVTLPLSQGFFWYNSSIGNNEDATTDARQASGAYIFRPNQTSTGAAYPVNTGAATVDLVTGPIVNEAQQVFAAGWLSQVVRLYANSAAVDFEWTVGPVPTNDGLGKEIVARYSTPMATNGTWWTDSNVRENYKRVRNYRSTWNYTVYEPIAGNYVPVNARIFTSDAKTGTTLSVAVDRSQGGSSMVDGSVELMVHRRILHDDSRGVGEPLDEPGLDWNGKGLVIRGVHRVTLDPLSSAASSGKSAIQDMNFKPAVTFAQLGSTAPASWAAGHKASFTGLSAPLPANVHLLTVHSQGPKSLLLRLAHLYEIGEDAALSQPATVALSGLFAGQTLSGCVEMTLTANNPLSAVPQLTVNIEGEGAVTYPTLPSAPAGPQQSITLTPMAIRTFECAVA